MTSFGMNAIGSAVALLVSLGPCLGDEQSRTPKSRRLPFELDAIVADPRDTVRVCRDIRAPRTDAKIPLPLIACLKNEKVQTIHLEGYGVEVEKDRVTLGWSFSALSIQAEDAGLPALEKRLLRELQGQRFVVHESEDPFFAHAIIRQMGETTEEVRIGNFCPVLRSTPPQVCARVSWRYTIPTRRPRITYFDLSTEAPSLTLKKPGPICVPDSFFDLLAARPLHSITVSGHPGSHGATLVLEEGISLRGELESLLQGAKFVTIPWDDAKCPEGIYYFLQGTSNSNCQVRMWIDDARLKISIRVQLPDDQR